MPYDELGHSFHEEDEGQVEREVNKGPYLLANRAEMMLWEGVKVEHVKEILECWLAIFQSKS